ncbi:MAG: hypothetical protein DMF49_05290 [Acidobacteria bacterium]|nr:MAG: hypothetical protein DMF49_05290 [Acidobacteriota bacterium]
MRKKLGAAAAVMGSAALIATACGAPAASTASLSSSAPPAPIAAAGNGDEVSVRAGSAEDVFLLTGELRAVRSLDLATPRSEAWQVQIKWLAEDGLVVREGDRVVEFDNSAIVQGIEEKKLKLIQSQIDLASREAALAAEREEKKHALESARIAAEKARIEASVPAELREMHDWQEKQMALRRAEAAEQKARLELEVFEVSAKSDLEVLRIAGEKAAREIESAERTLGSLSLMAPRTGILVVAENWREERKFQVGDAAWPGLTVASIPDLSQMEVIGQLSEVDDGRIEAGMQARCVLDTYPDKLFSGKVEEVAAVADVPGYRTKGGFRARISLERSDPALMRPGMSVRVEVLRRRWDHALTLPRHAVSLKDGKAWVRRAGASKPVEIKVAACTPADCIIEAGLSEGERVAIR